MYAEPPQRATWPGKGEPGGVEGSKLASSRPAAPQAVLAADRRHGCHERGGALVLGSGADEGVQQGPRHRAQSHGGEHNHCRGGSRATVANTNTTGARAERRWCTQSLQARQQSHNCEHKHHRGASRATVVNTTTAGARAPSRLTRLDVLLFMQAAYGGRCAGKKTAAARVRFQRALSIGASATNPSMPSSA